MWIPVLEIIPVMLPAVPGKAGQFRGWMLLSYGKPVTASTVKGEFQPSALTDELTKTFWLAEANDERQWVMIDLEKTGYCICYSDQLS